MLSTPLVRSASDLIDWFKKRPNEFFTKKMLLDSHGFSSNIGKNLSNLVTNNPHEENRLWRISAVDITNKSNKKQQRFYSYIIREDMNKETYTNLLQRANMDTNIKPKSKKKTTK